MGYKTLELTLISARDLKNVNLIGKMDVYVVVWHSGNPRNTLKTPVHQDGGNTPYWNYTVSFTVDESAAANSGWTVVFQLKHKSTFGRDKDVGQVRVPVKDLLDGFRDKKEAQVLTYQVQRPSGKPKGELKFSYRVTDVVDHQPVPPPVMAYPPQPSCSGAAVYPPPQAAYPPQSSYLAPPPTGYPYGGFLPPPQQQQAGYGCGYGYGYPVQAQRPRKNNGGFGMGLGAGLLGGAIGGLVIEDMVSDAYDDGYYDADVGSGDFDMDF